MRVIEYKTGRVYGSDQVLFITVETETENEYGMREITASFRDYARSIGGRVNAIAFPGDTVGSAVLAEYDAGRYATI